MWDQEKEHLKKFEQIVTERRVRPTVLVPLWNIAGYVLGAGTALLGKEAAMACTVAVEEVISEHYDNQLRELLSSEGVTDENKELLDTIKQFRDEELEHQHIGEENDAEQVRPLKHLKYSQLWRSYFGNSWDANGKSLKSTTSSKQNLTSLNSSLSLFTMIPCRYWARNSP